MSIFGRKRKEEGVHSHSVVIWGNAYQAPQNGSSKEQPGELPAGPHAAAVGHEIAVRDSVRQRAASLKAHPSRQARGSIRLR